MKHRSWRGRLVGGLVACLWLGLGVVEPTHAAANSPTHGKPVDHDPDDPCSYDVTSIYCGHTKSESGHGGGNPKGGGDPVKIDPKLLARYREFNKQHEADCRQQIAEAKKHHLPVPPNCQPKKPAPPIGVIIRRVFERVQLPKAQLQHEPTWGGLVHKAEIFYTTVEQSHTYQMTLLGQQITLRTHVDSYSWHWGDDSDPLLTYTPGGKYPNKDVTHTYEQPGDYQVSVDLNYSATFSVNGAPPVPIDGTLAIPGPAVPLHITTDKSILVGN